MTLPVRHECPRLIQVFRRPFHWVPEATSASETRDGQTGAETHCAARALWGPRRVCTDPRAPTTADQPTTQHNQIIISWYARSVSEKWMESFLKLNFGVLANVLYKSFIKQPACHRRTTSVIWFSRVTRIKMQYNTGYVFQPFCNLNEALLGQSYFVLYVAAHDSE